MSGKWEIGLEILASGSATGDGAIVVTTKDGADRVLDEYRTHVDSIESIDLSIVDCVSKQRGMEAVETDRRIRYTSSPVDMTGIGINISELLEEFYSNRGLTRNRILLNSLSTLLMYSNLKTVFRFLHVFTGRIQSADALGLYMIDSESHDDRTMNTLKQLFDGLIHVSEGGDVELQMARG